MPEKYFELNEYNLPLMEELGRHMPGGFFIYRADESEEVLYANDAVLEIFGCESQEAFKELTGNTFKGIVYEEDYEDTKASISEQLRKGNRHYDYVEYRIRRQDGELRWVEDYGHHTDGALHSGFSYVFISDITEKREQMETDKEIRQAVIEALSESYHTVWLINDVETESFSLYRGDVKGESAHASPIRDALKNMKYTQAKQYYIAHTVAPKDRERLAKELELPAIVARLKEKPQFHVDYLRTMDDGSEHYFRIEFARLNMPHNRMGVVCGFKDIDEDARAEIATRKALQQAKLAEAENRKLIEEVESAAKLADLMGSAASLLSNMPAMSFSKDALTGRYLACNQAFAEYAHKENPDGVIGLCDHDIFDKETADHFVSDDAKALAMDEPYIFFEDVPDAKGNMRSLQTTKIKFTDSLGRLCTLGMCVDVTEMSNMKLAEAEAKVKQEELESRLRLQEELLSQQKLKDQQDQLITALASDYRSVYYINLDRDEGVCYQSHNDIPNGLQPGDRFPYLSTFRAYADQYITDAYRDAFLAFIEPEAIKSALLTERIISYRYMVHRFGRDAYESIRFAGVRHPEDRDDNLVHSVGASFTDVDAETRKTLAEAQALQDALTSAREANKAKTAFLSSMSHEIRTPMNAIIGLNNIAMNDPETVEKTKEYLGKIDHSAKHLLNIINDILDMSRIESGRMVIRNEEFSFDKMLEQVNTIITGQCRDKGLHYTCRAADIKNRFYIGDDMKLRQVLINILGNAVKFTPEDGHVTLTIRETAHFEQHTTLQFVITDTGIGMDKDYLPHIFEAFSQEDASSTSRYGSTGLGMPITKSIVEMMNGTITVESEKGIGTTFTVTLSLKDASKSYEDIEALLPHELRILIIDDDPVSLEQTEQELHEAGIHTETALSGTEGLEKVRMHEARREGFDMILADEDILNDVKTLCARAKHECVMVLLTDDPDTERIREIETSGIDGCLCRPISSKDVMDTFKAILQKRKAAPVFSKAELEGRKILLAEDVDVNAEIMTMILHARGMTADRAENGRIACEKFAASDEGSYDAILMDMRMPEMDGLEAAKTIRAMSRTDAQTIPIIALTANAFDEDVHRSLQAGLNAHLSKPVEPERLYETLESLIHD